MSKCELKPTIKKRSRISTGADEKGMVLLGALALVSIIAALATVVVTSTFMEIKLSSNYKASTQALYAAQAGYEEARARLRGSSSDPNYAGDPAANPDPTWSAYILTSNSWQTSDDPNYVDTYTNYIPTTSSHTNTTVATNTLQATPDISYWVKIRHKREADLFPGEQYTDNGSGTNDIIYYGYATPGSTTLEQFTTTDVNHGASPVEIITSYGGSGTSSDIIEIQTRKPPGPPIVAAVYGDQEVHLHGNDVNITGDDAYFFSEEDIALIVLIDDSSVNSSGLKTNLLAASLLSDSVLNAAIDRNPSMISSDLKDVLLNASASPLATGVLQSIVDRAPSMSTSDNKVVLIANSPLPTSILNQVIAGNPPMDPSDRQEVLDEDHSGGDAAHSSDSDSVPAIAYVVDNVNLHDTYTLTSSAGETTQITALDLATHIDALESRATRILDDDDDPLFSYTLGSSSNYEVIFCDATQLSDQKLTLMFGTGYGILVVRGKVSFTGTTSWNGLIIASDEIKFEGSTWGTINGAMLSAINPHIKGWVDVNYNSYEIDKAKDSFRYDTFRWEDKNLN